MIITILSFFYFAFQGTSKAHLSFFHILLRLNNFFTILILVILVDPSATSHRMVVFIAPAHQLHMCHGISPLIWVDPIGINYLYFYYSSSLLLVVLFWIFL
jgi:hypothetical protein